MQKKFSLVLLVTALSSFVPSYGLGTKAGAKKRKISKLQKAQIQQETAITPAGSTLVSGLQIDEIVTTPIKFILADQTVGLVIEEDPIIAAGIASDDKGDATKTTSTVDDSKSSKRVMFLASLKTIGASISDGLSSLFN